MPCNTNFLNTKKRESRDCENIKGVVIVLY